MKIGRVLTFAVAVAVLGAAPALVAQQNNQQSKRDQEKRSQQEQQDIQALVKLVDAVSMGQQPAPTDIAVTWESNHFVKGGDSSTYIPFSLVLDKSKIATPAAAVCARTRSTTARSASSSASFAPRISVSSAASGAKRKRCWLASVWRGS